MNRLKHPSPLELLSSLPVHVMQNVQEVVANALNLHSSEISTLKEIIAKQEESIAKLLSLTTVQQVRGGCVCEAFRGKVPRSRPLLTRLRGLSSSHAPTTLLSQEKIAHLTTVTASASATVEHLEKDVKQHLPKTFVDLAERVAKVEILPNESFQLNDSVVAQHHINHMTNLSAR